VDDSPTYLEKIVLELEREGYQVREGDLGQGMSPETGRKALSTAFFSTWSCGDGRDRSVSADIGERMGMSSPLAVLMLTAQESKDDLMRALEAVPMISSGSPATCRAQGRLRASCDATSILRRIRKIIEELKPKSSRRFARGSRGAARRGQRWPKSSRCAPNQELEATNKSCRRSRIPSPTISGRRFAPSMSQQVSQQDYADRLDDEAKTV